MKETASSKVSLLVQQVQEATKRDVKIGGSKRKDKLVNKAAQQLISKENGLNENSR